jgi:hypothetical protein
MPPIQSWEAENLATDGAVTPDTSTPPLTPGLEAHLQLDWAHGDASAGKAVLLKPGQKLSLEADLKPGVYCIWVRGRSTQQATNRVPNVPSYLQKLSTRWAPLYLSYSLDDKPWTMRCRYDKFYYNIGRFYFSIETPGRHKLAVGNAAGSKADVLLDRLDLLDILQNTARVAYKKQVTLLGTESVRKLEAAIAHPDADLSTAQVREADAKLWDSVPDPHDEVVGWLDRLSFDSAAHNKAQDGGDAGLSMTEFERAHQAEAKWYAASSNLRTLIEQYRQTGSTAKAHQAAVLLLGMARVYPLLDYNVLGLQNTIADMGFTYYDQATGSYNYSGWAPPVLGNLATAYDTLFPYLTSANDPALVALAHSSDPNIDSMSDIRAMIETRVLQYGADQLLRRILRGGDGIWENALATVAAVQGPSPIADHWWDAMLFQKTHMSNQNRGGLVDLFTNGVLRDGCNYIGQANYASYMAATMGNVMVLTRRYREMGGDARFDIFDPATNLKAAAGATFALDTRVAGGFVTNIGEGYGTPGRGRQPEMTDVLESQRPLWSLSYASTPNPRLAWLLKLAGRSEESDAQWNKIEKDAASIPSPMTHSDTRALHGFGATFLEAGVASDDLHDKRAVSLRTGVARGHAHHDTLDIEIFGKDLRLSADDGGRGGDPDPHLSRSHNMVEIDGKSFFNEAVNTSGTGWLLDLQDAPGLRFAEGAGRAHQVPQATTFQRAVALIDIDEHDSYLFDFWRVKGGAQHTWCFHGPLFDGFETNAQNLTPVAATSDLGQYLDGKNMQQGQAPAVLEDDWKALKSDAHLRSTLFGAGDSQFLMSDTLRPYQASSPDQRYVFVRRTGDNLESGWLHLIEPYENTPRITARRQLELQGGPSPADGGSFAIRAAARTDIVYYDATAAAAAQSDGLAANWDGHGAPASGEVRFHGKFGYVSWDGGKLRALNLVDGTEISAGGVSIRPSVARYEGTVRSVLPNYSGFTTDIPIAPYLLKNEVVAFDNNSTADQFHQHHTSFDVTGVTNGQGGSVVKLKGDPTTFQGKVIGVDSAKQHVTFEVPLSLREADRSWYNGMTLANESGTKFWKVKDTSGDNLDVDAPVAESDFTDADKDGRALGYLRDYGPGDHFSISTSVSLRVVPGGYQLETNVPVQIKLPEGSYRVDAGRWSFNGKQWQKQ